MKLLCLIFPLCLFVGACEKPNTRQKIVETFGTTDVFPLANDNYIARDTNGAVWFVDSRFHTNYCTKIFNDWK